MAKPKEKNGVLEAFTFPDGDCYTGSWKSDKRDGQGVHKKHSGEILEGEWKKDLFIQGTISFPNGDRYEGPVNKKRQFEGNGALVNQDGTRFEGEFKKGIRTKGTMLCPPASEYIRYVGNFDKDGNLFSGAGTLVWRPGNEYQQFDGTFVNGEWTQGKMQYSNGSICNGNWNKRLPDGQCTRMFDVNSMFVKFDGTYKAGIFADGQLDYRNGDSFHGLFTETGLPKQGTLTYSNGVVYSGTLNDDLKRQGRGELSFPDGRKVAGDFHDDYCVRGTVTYKNGDNYTGELRPGNPSEFVPHGRGKQCWGSGPFEYFNGQFVDGIAVHGELSSTNPPSVYRGHVNAQLQRNSIVRNSEQKEQEHEIGAPGGAAVGAAAADLPMPEGEALGVLRQFVSRPVPGIGSMPSLNRRESVVIVSSDGGAGDENVFTGIWANDALEHGTVSYSSGEHYTGSLDAHLRKHTAANHEAKLSLPDGRTFIGSFSENNPTKGVIDYTHTTLSDFDGLQSCTGDVDPSLDPHGQATLTFKNSDTMEGSWDHGKMHGQGRRTFASTNSEYTGEWSQGAYYKGKFVYGTRSDLYEEYEGEFKRHKSRAPYQYTLAAKKGSFLGVVPPPPTAVSPSSMTSYSVAKYPQSDQPSPLNRPGDESAGPDSDNTPAASSPARGASMDDDVLSLGEIPQTVRHGPSAVLKYKDGRRFEGDFEYDRQKRGTMFHPNGIKLVGDFFGDEFVAGDIIFADGRTLPHKMNQSDEEQPSAAFPERLKWRLKWLIELADERTLATTTLLGPPAAGVAGGPMRFSAPASPQPSPTPASLLLAASPMGSELPASAHAAAHPEGEHHAAVAEGGAPGSKDEVADSTVSLDGSASPSEAATTTSSPTPAVPEFVGGIGQSAAAAEAKRDGPSAHAVSGLDIWPQPRHLSLESTQSPLPVDIARDLYNIQSVEGAARLERLQKERSQFLEDSKKKCGTVEDALRNEEAADQRNSAYFRERWLLKPSAELTVDYWKSLRGFKAMLEEAVGIDDAQRAVRLRLTADHQELWDTPIETFHAQIVGTEAERNARLALEPLMNQVHTQLADQNRMVNELKHAADELDPLPKILDLSSENATLETAVALLDAELAQLDKHAQQLEDLRTEHGQVLNKVVQTFRDYINVTLESRNQVRNALIAKLETAIGAFLRLQNEFTTDERCNSGNAEAINRLLADTDRFVTERASAAKRLANGLLLDELALAISSDKAGPEMQRAVEAILANPAATIDVNEKSPTTNKTALQVAVEIGRAQSVALLASKGADPNIPASPHAQRVGHTNSLLRCALELAQREAREECFRALLLAYADINVTEIPSSGDNLLHMALADGPGGSRFHWLQLLLEQPALIVSTRNFSGMTALHMACRADSMGDEPVAQAGAGGAPVDALVSMLATVAKLIHRGAPPNLRDQQGNAPLHMTSNYQTQMFLVQHGARPDLSNLAKAVALKPTPATKKAIEASVKFYSKKESAVLESVIAKGDKDWVDDNEVNECSLCCDKFTLFNRRHHCRRCGQVCCSKCTGKETKADKSHKIAAQRVCDPCFNRLSPQVFEPVQM